MAVFRIEKNTGYTVMSNHHLRNKNLTLKAKGLLSQMLSLPEDWDYTLKGLALINKEKIDAIREAIRELEREGYVVRSRVRDEKGRLRGTEYVIYERPQQRGPEDHGPYEPEDDDLEPDEPEQKDHVPETPTSENPMLDKPMLENPTLENPTQLNKDILSIDSSSKDQSITDPSLPTLPFGAEVSKGQGGRGQEEQTEASSGDTAAEPESPNAPDDLPVDDLGYMAAEPPKGLEGSSLGVQADFDACRRTVLDNIDYNRLVDTRPSDRENIDEIVDLILEILCASNRTIRIAGTDYPAEIVKNKFSKLRSEHIIYALDSVRENAPKIRSMRQYMRTVLFNAPSTLAPAHQERPVRDDLERLKRLLAKQSAARKQEEESAKAFDATYGIKKGPTPWGRTFS